jgi:hypothetical protein
MADQVPIRADLDGSSLTGLAIFSSGETVGVAHGGTGATSLTDNGILVGNAAGVVQATDALTTNGQVVIGGTSGPAVANITGTADEVDITNGDGTITVGLSTSYSPAAVLQRAAATGLDITAKTAENASSIILVDLTDPTTMWDVESFLAATRYTSWRAELGAPPMRGAMFLNNAATELHWWNLDTDAAYMQFDVGGSSNSDANMIYISSIKPSCIYFLDGKIFFGVSNGGGGGLWIIDFLKDECIGWFASGQRRYSGNIEERNDGKGNVSTRTSLQIRNGVVKSTAAYRHSMEIDEFGRPLHYWLAGTDSGPSVYNPVDNAIYTSADAQDTDSAAITPSGDLWMTQDFHTADGHQLIMYKIEDFDENSTVQTGYFAQTVDARTNGSQSLSFFTSSWNPADGGLGAYDGGVAGGSLGIMGTDQGLVFEYFPSGGSGNNKLGGAILVTSTFNTPYMKALRVAAYPLNDTADQSGNGHTLTNNGTVTFASGGPTGKYADFVAASSQSLTCADHADFGGMSELTLSCWVNRDIDAGADVGILSKFSTTDGSNQSFTLVCYHGGGDTVLFEINTSGGSGSVESTTSLVVGEWTHIAATYDGATMKIYINGLLEQTAARTGTIDDSAEQFIIGARSGNTNTEASFFDGKIGGVYIGATAMTYNEVKLEYQRGLRVLGGATALLGATDVDSVRTDPHTGLTAVCVNNQVEIWNAMGVRESINATTTATLNDADVRLPEGADEPLIAMGRSGQIGVVAPDRRLLG